MFLSQKMTPKTKDISFTLIELIIILIILGILVSLSIPVFTKTKERVLNREAAVNLRLIRAAEEIYRMEVGWYIACADTSEVNENLDLSLRTIEPNWNYKVDVPNSARFIGKAQRTASDGRVLCLDEISEETYSCPW